MQSIMKKASSSDYITIKKQKTIYTELKNNLANNNTPNPIKLNGNDYNNNIIVYDASCNSFSTHSCIKFAKSFDLLLNYSKGKEYVCRGCKNTSCFPD